MRWTGSEFVAVTKVGDWFGTTVFLDRAPAAQGPWTTYARDARGPEMRPQHVQHVLRIVGAVQRERRPVDDRAVEQPLGRSSSRRSTGPHSSPCHHPGSSRSPPAAAGCSADRSNRTVTLGCRHGPVRMGGDHRVVPECPPMMTRSTRSAAPAVRLMVASAACATLLLAACSGSDDAAPTGTATDAASTTATQSTDAPTTDAPTSDAPTTGRADDTTRRPPTRRSPRSRRSAPAPTTSACRRSRSPTPTATAR